MTNASAKGQRTLAIPPGDDKKRAVCNDCGHIEYGNPKPIVGVVATWQDKILLCRRAIPPRKGFWTVPAGYMEGTESSEEGAIRETKEESGADVKINALLGIYDIPQHSQVHMFFRGELSSPDLDPGSESLEARLFDWDEIPWNDLAFPITEHILRYHQKTKNQMAVVPERRTVPPINQPLKPAP